MSSGASAKYKKEQVGFSCSEKGSPGGNRHRGRPQVPRYLLPAHFLSGGLTPQIALDGNCPATIKVKGRRTPLARYFLARPEGLAASQAGHLQLPPA